MLTTPKLLFHESLPFTAFKTKRKKNCNDSQTNNDKNNGDKIV